jgi:hypothetical protein
MVCYIGDDGRPLRAAARHSLAQLRRSVTEVAVAKPQLRLGVVHMAQYLSAASQRDFRFILVPYEVCHLVETQVWLGEDVVQQRSVDLWGNA